MEVATQQAPPSQVSPPVIDFYNSTVILLTWSSPAVPNGIIHRYVVYDITTSSTAVIGSDQPRQLLLTGKMDL